MSDIENKKTETPYNGNIKIAIDLELEQPFTNKQTPDSKIDKEKIIQLGYTVINVDTASIYEAGCYNIKYEHPLSQFIKDLTGITDEDLADGISIDEAYDMLVSLREKYNCSRQLLQWGGGDDQCIKVELSPEKQWIFGRSSFNVKHLYQVYAMANGLNPSGGLRTSMKKLKIRWENLDGKGAHNAGTDAFNTARTFFHLLQRYKQSSGYDK